MFKKIVRTAFILMTISSLALWAVPENDSTSALFFQYSYDNDFREIDSVGAYMKVSEFYDSKIGSSFGATFELPIGYSNDRISYKISGFGGPSFKFRVDSEDSLLTIGPCITTTMLTDTYYSEILFDLGFFVDMANSYPVSEKVDAIIGGALIYDIARYSMVMTASANDSDFEQEFSQFSGKIYLGFSVSK